MGHLDAMGCPDVAPARPLQPRAHDHDDELAALVERLAEVAPAEAGP